MITDWKAQTVLSGDAKTREELSAGLLANPAQIAPKYFYDDLGSSLFTSICRLTEYYPTRTEADIFASAGAQMSQVAKQTLGQDLSLIDLGAGDCQKAAKLFDRIEPQRYYPVDVSANFVSEAAQKLAVAYPHIQVQALGRDLSKPWEMPEACPKNGRLFFYPGSSIGNFTPDEAVQFLQHLRATSPAGCGLLIGVDAVKPIEVLEPAYDDALGVTAAFNLNVLAHVNRLLGSDFNVRDWRHVAFFNAQASRIEMHLEAVRTHDVAWPSAARRFVAGDRILTEYSYKYRPEDFSALLGRAGFKVEKIWQDSRQWFSVFYAQA